MIVRTRPTIRPLLLSVVAAASIASMSAAIDVASSGRVGSTSPESAWPEAPDSSARHISLEEALAIAERSTPQAISAAGQLTTAHAAVRSSYAAFLPSLSVSASASRRLPADDGGTRVENGQVVTVPSTPWSSSVGLGASVDLFSGGRRIFDLTQAKAGVLEAEANANATRYEVILSVKQAYFAVLSARESAAAAVAQATQAEEQRRAVLLRLTAGTATLSDSLRAEIQLASARLAVSQSRNDVAVTAAALTHAIGATEAITASDTPPAEDAPIALDAASLLAGAEQGPVVQEADARLRGAEAAKRSSWSAYLPSLSASYNRGGSGAGEHLGSADLSYSGSVRFSLSLPLWNQYSREETAIRSGVALKNAEASAQDARLAAREDLTRVLGTYRLARERVMTQITSVSSAEEDLRVQQQRYGLGSSTLLDLLTSQSQLNDARQALIQARYDQRIARAQLEALLGQTL